MTDLAQVIALRDELVAQLREYSESQTELWRQVPWLSLQADGRSGGMGFYDRTYRLGLWPVEDGGSSLAVAVDCNSGRIIFPRQVHNLVTLEAASVVKILQLAVDPARLDAQQVIDYLKKKATQPRPSYISAAEALARDKERRALAHRYGLTKIFSRPDKVAA